MPFDAEQTLPATHTTLAHNRLALDAEQQDSGVQKDVLPQKLPRQIFRAYDIRGKVALLDDALIAKIAYAMASVLVEQQQTVVVIGFDARLTSHSYADIMSDILYRSGLTVINIGCVSSPLLYFTALQYEGNGIMITASHNPVSDNGVKWLYQGLPPSPQQIQDIADRIEQQEILSQPHDSAQYHIHHYQHSDAINHQDQALTAYQQFIQQDIQLQHASDQSIHISLDGLNGSAGKIAQQILCDLGCQVNALHCDANGHFPLGAPDPSVLERLIDLKQSVLQQGSLLGIALDGDGDRLVVLDDKGQYVSLDRLICLFAKICLLVQPYSEIVCDVKCSSMLRHTVQHYTGQLGMIRTGSSFLRQHLHQYGAIFGGEFAGHYVFNDGRGKGFDDGLYAALRIIEYVLKTGQPLSEILAEFPERVASQDIYLDSDGTDFITVADSIAAYIDDNPTTNAGDSILVSRIDGVRLDLPFGFGLIRASNTGEYFTLRFDADTLQHLLDIRQLFDQALRAYHPEFADRLMAITVFDR